MVIYTSSISTEHHTFQSNTTALKASKHQNITLLKDQSVCDTYCERARCFVLPLITAAGDPSVCLSPLRMWRESIWDLLALARQTSTEKIKRKTKATDTQCSLLTST